MNLASTSSENILAHQSPTILLETPLERNLRLFNRRLGLIRTLDILLGIGAFNIVLLGLALLILAQKSIGLILAGGSCTGLIAYALSYYLTRRAVSAKWADFAGYALLAGAFNATLIAQLAFGAQPNGILAGFVALPILAGIIELGRRAMIIVSLLGATALGLLYTLQILFKVYIPDPILQQYPLIDLIIWLVVLGIAASGIYVFTQRLHQASTLSDKQNEQLHLLLNALNSTHQLSMGLSHQLSGVAAELSAASQQQAGSTQEQAAAVTQLTSSLTELGITANQIAASASATAESASQTVTTASEVKEASLLAEATALQGNEAVEQSVSSVEQVRYRIEVLGERLLELTQQTHKASNIIDLIEEIAGETHLLALNASIEAAGNSGGQETAGEYNVRGERFGVIAQEVKNLADRSKQAAKEVRDTVTEIGVAVGAAVMVAEEGKKETALAVGRSRLAGAVIEKLTQIISKNAQQADQILVATEAVKQFGEEIRTSTFQQRSTNQQIITIMQSVSDVSQQNAQAVRQLSETSARVYDQIDQLNLVLAQTNQSNLQGKVKISGPLQLAS